MQRSAGSRVQVTSSTVLCGLVRRHAAGLEAVAPGEITMAIMRPQKQDDAQPEHGHVQEVDLLGKLRALGDQQ